MNYILFVCTLISFSIVYTFTPWFIRYLQKIGLVVQDQNKKNRPLVPLSGGLIVFGGIVSGLLFFVFVRTFFQFSLMGFDEFSLTLIFAAMLSIFLITLVGFLDDLVIKSDKSTSVGLKQWQKPLLTLVAAVPLMAVKAGTTTMTFPFYGFVDVGLLYPLLFVPLGVVGAANMINMLAGFNGQETGIGLVYTGMLGFYGIYHDELLASLISFVVFGALLGFYMFNKTPAKILPGDSLTYLLGGVLASIIILGNFEKAGLVIAIPFFVEFILKWRGDFKEQSYGKFENGKLYPLTDKIYSIPHIFIRNGRVTEKQLNLIMILIQLFFASLIWLI